MVSALTFLALTLQAGAAQADAPDRLITNQGVELLSDERVFVLFAALNGLGYSEETQRKGPPLRAPVYHPIRTQVRDAMRKLDEAGKLASVKSLFDENPGEIEAYLEALLAAESARSPEAQKLAPAIGALEGFRQKAELSKLFDSIAVEQRNHAKELKQRLEKSFAEAAPVLGLPELRATTAIVVVPNPLDGHDVVRRLQSKDTLYLIVGPGFPAAERAILDAAIRGAVAKAAETAYAASGSKYAKHWETVKSSPRLSRRFADGKAYFVETVASVLAFRARAKLAQKPISKEAEEEFLDELNKDDLRWGRFVLRALDGFTGQEPLEAALGKGLAKSFP